MKKKILLFIGGLAVMLAISVTVFGFLNQSSVASPAPVANPEANFSNIYIHCSSLGTNDYATIRWKGYTTDCQGYTPDWVDEGTFYFNASGEISKFVDYQLGELTAQIVVYKAGYPDCPYYAQQTSGYHSPCNTTMVSVSFNIGYPWECPEE